MKKTILSVAVSGIWITVSEFARNEIIFRSYWVDHFDSIGIKFETLPLNGFLWLIWSFILAYVISRLHRRFSMRETIALAWLPAFVMMWIAIYNLQVLPLRLLTVAVPLSLLEVAVAAVIFRKIENESCSVCSLSIRWCAYTPDDTKHDGRRSIFFWSNGLAKA